MYAHADDADGVRVGPLMQANGSTVWQLLRVAVGTPDAAGGSGAAMLKTRDIDVSHNILTGNASLFVELFGNVPFRFNCFDPAVPPSSPSCSPRQTPGC
jgi:hypothetical protein